MSEVFRKKLDSLPLKAHAFLAGVPLHSFDYSILKGGREEMTVAEIYAAAGLSEIGEVRLGFLTKALFWLRGLIGRIFGWDDVPELVAKTTYLTRLSAEERARSAIEPGTVKGIARVLYCFENEMMLEIINRTVHCFWLIAKERTTEGYVLYNAVYVKKLNWRTPIYMTLVSPLLKWIIYPAINKSIAENWKQAFPAGDRRRQQKLAAVN